MYRDEFSGGVLDSPAQKLWYAVKTAYHSLMYLLSVEQRGQGLIDQEA